MTADQKLPISLVVITANEERNLARCLGSADFCSEFVVVDSGSVDRTVEIATEHGAKVFPRGWEGYVAQKNFACQQASQPWILCLDADEVVSAELRQSITRAFESEPATDGFELNRHSYYGAKLINHSGWYPQWRLFLFRRGQAEWTGPEPHAEVRFKGRRKGRLRGDLYHYTYADIRQHVRKNARFAYDAAVAMEAAGRNASIFRIVFHPPWAVFRSYVIQLGFLDGLHGMTIAVVSGFYTFLKYALLREMRSRSTFSSSRVNRR